MSWQLVLTGALTGMLVGVTGMGGGSLMTPLLVILFGFDPAVAVGTDLFHGAIFKTVGAARHRRLGTVQARLSGWMLVGSAPMSLVGVATATWLKHRYGGGAVSAQTLVLGVALLLGGVGLAAKAFMPVPLRADDAFEMKRRDRVAAVLIGLVGGFIVGLTSVGSGVFFGLTMLVVFPLRSIKVVGTDIFHAAALLWVAGFGHLVAGNVDLSAVAWLLVGSVPGVLVGSQISVRLPDRTLRLLMATTLVASAAKLMRPPHADAVALAILGVGVAATVILRFTARPSLLTPTNGVPAESRY
jgi:uncharacterized protein